MTIDEALAKLISRIDPAFITFVAIVGLYAGNPDDPLLADLLLWVAPIYMGGVAMLRVAKTAVQPWLLREQFNQKIREQLNQGAVKDNSKQGKYTNE